MQYTHEVQNMCCVAKGPNHGPAPIPEEGKCFRSCRLPNKGNVPPKRLLPPSGEEAVRR